MNGHHKQAAPTELGVLKRGIYKRVAPAGAEKADGPNRVCNHVLTLQAGLPAPRSTR